MQPTRGKKEKAAGEGTKTETETEKEKKKDMDTTRMKRLDEKSEVAEILPLYY
jgi:hypothetical protein